MQPIALEFDLGNYRYTQLERHQDLALYEQRHKEAAVVRYEVVRIRLSPAYTWPDGHRTPEHEAYPGSSTWGRDGFTCFSRPEAAHLLAQLAAERQPRERDPETIRPQEGV